MTKKINYTTEELLNKKFSPAEKGYNALEVDQVFDKIIEDYKQLQSLIDTLNSENAKHSEEIKDLDKKLREADIQIAKLKAQLDAVPKMEGLNQDNYTLIKKVSAYERVLYKKGINPKKALSDPDNC